MNELVLYIEKEKFLRQMLEGIFKAKNAKIHTEDGIQDRFYLLEDLNPNIIIVDLDSVTDDELTQLLTHQSSKFIATSKNSDLINHNDSRFSKILVKPLIVATLYEQIFKNN